MKKKIKMSEQQSCSNSGFTLVEIIIVIVVIGVMSTIAIPNYLTWRPDMTLKAAARDLYSTMQQAKLLAVKTNADVAIVFDITNNRYYLCDSPGADALWTGVNDNIGTGDNTIRTTVDLIAYKYGISYGHGTITGANSVTTPPGTFPGDEVSYGSNVLTFNPQAVGNGGYVYLDNEKNTVYAVGTLTSGVIRLRRWMGGGWQ